MFYGGYLLSIGCVYLVNFGECFRGVLSGYCMYILGKVLLRVL